MKGKLVIHEYGEYLERMAKTLASIAHGATYVKVGLMGAEKEEKAGGEVRQAKAGRDFRGRYLKRGTSVAAKGGGTPIDVVMLGLVHEFGSPRRHIPERPWIRGAFDANRSKYHTMVADFLRGVLEEKITIQRALGLLGQEMVADIQAYVRSGDKLEPLKPATVERKMAKGRTAMGRKQGPVRMPIALIDTERMLGSVSYQVVINGRPVGGVKH